MIFFFWTYQHQYRVLENVASRASNWPCHRELLLTQIHTSEVTLFFGTFILPVLLHLNQPYITAVFPNLSARRRSLWNYDCVEWSLSNQVGWLIHTLKLNKIGRAALLAILHTFFFRSPQCEDMRLEYVVVGVCCHLFIFISCCFSMPLISM